jgi:murein DD-endopeptidase MepM/ murein hydrolase activator NlpD
MSMRSGLIGATVGASVVALLGVGAVVVIGAAYLDSLNPATTTVQAASCGAPGGGTVQNVAAVKAADGWSPSQTANATVIVQVGGQMGVPPRGWVIAVATAMQESGLRNLANPYIPESGRLPHEGSGTDHDSVGLFQQRQSWGSTAELMNPAVSARKFYDALLKVSGWQAMPLTVAAQRVQRSGFPDAYAKHEGPAARLVNAVTGGAALAASTSGQCAKVGEVTAGGWTAPVAGADVGDGFGPRNGKMHNGVDLIVPKRTPIKAASDGVVIAAHCDASTATKRSCDLDGGVNIPGCGWLVDIRHAGNIVTRYCHMIVQPIVAVGQHVAAGQQIGWSGTSGHSSGPHLHFETHANTTTGTSASAVDPVLFMQQRGVSLGKRSAV